MKEDIKKSFEKYKLNLSYHFAELLNQPLAKPHWIYLSLINDCTLRCRMCGVKNLFNKEQINFEKIKEILDEIVEWKTDQRLMLTGGEPFLRKDIFDIIDYSTSLGITTEVVSNGTLITEDIAEKIIKSRLANIAISLDGATAETHDYIRSVKGTFNKATNALKHLSSFKKKYGKGPQISVWVTIQRNNIKELYNIIDLTKKLGVECLVYHPVIINQLDMRNTNSDGPLWLTKDDIPIFEEQVKKINDYKTKKGYVAFLHDPKLFAKYFKNESTAREWKCNPFEFLSIGPNGNLQICGDAFDNITNKKIEEALGTKEARKVRQEMKNCKKNCMQTCWARPEADNLLKIGDVFLNNINNNKNSEENISFLKKAINELEKYEDILLKKWQ